MSELLAKLEREILPLVMRPGRYTGGERNAPLKPAEDVDLRFLLAFPDVYEIGMSHLGIRVLYDILNGMPRVAAERCFAPWIDLEALMRDADVPLFSIESHSPARDFDIIGFTLQYELHYATILAMLDLAGVPLRARDRGDGDPLVVGGGPSALNPEPMAAFFDLLVIGDGETAVVELSQLVLEAKRKGRARGEVLRRAAGLRGVYVPSLYEERRDAAGRYAGTAALDCSAPERVVRRVERALDYDCHPSVPIVPVTETTHDRLSVEIMRGCTRGCRFCQPGMITRPVRMRPAEDVARLVEEGLEASGYDEVSLVSLSTSDFDGLPGLISRLNDRLFDRKVSVSLPSLRVDRFGLELADGLGRVRRAGLTFAPEAGTQRLRDVVNKNETEESILETVDVAFASGWNRIKLYFMIGLPTETQEDLEGIVELVSKVRKVARGRKKGARLSVSISPFVPRAHTPFQWERQDSPSEMNEKERFLRSGIREKSVKLSTRDPEVSFLEGVMSRGGRELGDVVEAAFRAGARFDGWTETFDFGVWRSAFATAKVDPEKMLGPLDVDAPLPWDHIDGGPSKAFLASEREKALAGDTTADCRETGCFGCGACDAELAEVVGAAADAREGEAAATGASSDGAVASSDGAVASATEVYGRRDRKLRDGNGAGYRWRVRYRKGDAVRFISHLDVVRVILRALSMSELPVVFTQGFNPHPKLSFGPPLPVGATGEAEFFDLELARLLDEKELAERLSSGLPEGLDILSVSRLTSKLSASAVAEAAEYTIGAVPGLEGLSREQIEERITALRAVEEAEVLKGGTLKKVRPKEQILGLELVDERRGGLRAVLALGREGSMRPRDVVGLLTEGLTGRPELARIHRTALLRRPLGGVGELERVR